MRITQISLFQADGGWRPFGFLKIATDQGLIGWSEFALGAWAPGLPQIIESLGARVVGKDPRAYAKLTAELVATTRFAAGGLAQQAISAIENACVDIAAKAAGVPVCVLFGGPFRDKLELYWSHCGSFRARDREFFGKVLGLPPLETLADMEELGREVVRRGYRAAKINPIVFADDGPRLLNPGFAPGFDFGLRLDPEKLDAIADQAAAFVRGLAGRARALLDLNFGFNPAGFERIVQRLEDIPLMWLEMDVHNPAALADVRAAAGMPVASLETIYGRAGYRPYLDAGAVDVAIVDVPWNGIAESVRIAALAETHQTNVAPHNFYGPLADLMAAHFCAAVPNFEIMEIETDDVPWKYDLLSRPPAIADGMIAVPTAPGWGADVNEEALAAHPWRGS